MLSEVNRVFHSDNVKLVVGVVVLQVLHNVQFNLRLVFEFLFVSDDLDRYNFASLVVLAFKRLSK